MVVVHHLTRLICQHHLAVILFNLLEPTRSKSRCWFLQQTHQAFHCRGFKAWRPKSLLIDHLTKLHDMVMVFTPRLNPTTATLLSHQSLVTSSSKVLSILKMLGALVHNIIKAVTKTIQKKVDLNCLQIEEENHEVSNLRQVGFWDSLVIVS